jgi:hypothetical protein
MWRAEDTVARMCAEDTLARMCAGVN